MQENKTEIKHKLHLNCNYRLENGLDCNMFGLWKYYRCDSPPMIIVQYTT